MMLDAPASVCHAYLRNASLNPVQGRPENLNKDKQLKKDAQSQQCGYTPLTGQPDRNTFFVSTCTLMPLRETPVVKHNRKASSLIPFSKRSESGKKAQNSDPGFK